MAKNLSGFFPQMVSASEFEEVFVDSKLPTHVVARLSKIYTKMAKEMAMAFSIQSRIDDMNHFSAIIDLHASGKNANKKAIQSYKEYCESTLQDMKTVADRNTTFFHKEDGVIPNEFFKIF